MAQKATAKRAKVVPHRRNRPKATWRKPVKALAAFFMVALACFIGWATYLFNVKLTDAKVKVQNLGAMMDKADVPATKIFSADGQLLFQSIKMYRKHVSLDQVPQVIIDSTLAAEDKRFYQHDGVDEWALFRQIVTNVKERRVAGGGSTLTMQLAKRAFSQSERTMDRKIDDMALAMQIEKTYTKTQILEMYLNEAYYGAGAVGIRAAAQVYFGKNLQNVTLAEAALLARCVRRPSDENPFVNLKKATTNRNVVLRIMRTEGMIDEAAYLDASTAEVKLNHRMRAKTIVHEAPYFVNYVLKELEKLPELSGVNILEGGYRINTTLDLRVQAVSDKEARNIVENNRRGGVRAAAFLLTKRDGSIVAMTGGIDFNKRQFNAVTMGSRQPGSSFKPFVYGVAFDRGQLGPNSTISNATVRERDGDKWWTVAGDGRQMSVKSAIAYSKNPAAVRALELVTPRYFVTRAHQDFGFTSDLPAVRSLVLGSSGVSLLEMARGYSVFQTKGERVEPYGVVRVAGPEGDIIFQHASNSNVVQTNFSAAAAWDVDLCLREVVLNGTARPSGVSAVRNARGKTGTTNDNRDAWFCGYTNSYIGIGWVSGERVVDDKLIYPPMSSAVMGGTVTGKMWRGVLLYAQAKLGEEDRDDTPEGGPRNIESPIAGDDPNAGPNDELPVAIEPEPGQTPPPDERPVVEPDPQEEPQPETPPDELPDGVPLPEGPTTTSGETVGIRATRRAI